MKTLITGSSGFIGKELMRAVEHPIPYDIQQGRDILNDLLLEFYMRQCDIVYHLAGNASVPTSDRPEIYRLQTEGAARVFRMAKKLNKRVVFASSWAVYLGNTHYGASKFAAELAGQVEGNVTNVRLCNVYGPGQPSLYAIPIFLQKAIEGSRITIEGGSQLRDYIHVKDVAEGLWAARDYIGTTDLGSRAMTPLNEVVDIIQGIHPVQVDYVAGRKDDNGPSSNVELDWQAKIKLEDGIKDVYESMVRKSNL